MLLELLNKVGIIRDYFGILPIQLMFMELQIVAPIQKSPRTNQKGCRRIKSEVAVAGFGIGQLAGRKALDRVKLSAIHCETVCMEQVGQRTVPRKRS